MAAIQHGDDQRDESSTHRGVTVREPRQQRTRHQWDRVLDAGVQLLEEGGYEAFTIAALCERAAVPPRALYARVDTKDGLFLAVYERGMARVLTGHDPFLEPERWELLDGPERVALAVRYLVASWLDHAAFLRAVVLISGAHPEVRRRGEAYRSTMSDIFTSALSPLDATSTHPDPPAARAFCFALVFSAMVVHTAYGPALGLGADQAALVDELTDVAQRYLQTG